MSCRDLRNGEIIRRVNDIATLAKTKLTLENKLYTRVRYAYDTQMADGLSKIAFSDSVDDWRRVVDHPVIFPPKAKRLSWWRFQKKNFLFFELHLHELLSQFEEVVGLLLVIEHTTHRTCDKIFDLLKFELSSFESREKWTYS